MSTNMYGAIEVKHGDKWAYVKHVDCPQSYGIFNKLAGVRRFMFVEGNPWGRPVDYPKWEPRGEPDGMSAEIKAPEDDAYSTSWLTLAEIMTVDWKPDHLRGFQSVIDVMKSEGEPDSVRLVFWFD